MKKSILKKSKIYETIIIGAGICGLTAAMYASRKKMIYKIISKDFGGQFMVSGEVLNYPGLIKTTGIDFSEIMAEQMKFNQVKVSSEEVQEIKRKNRSKHSDLIVITNKKKYHTKTVILATGSKPRLLNVFGEKEFANKGITYCSICDGPIFAKKKVVIVGGGASALEAVDFMKNIASKIYMLVNGDKFTGHEYLIEKVKKNKKVQVFFNAQTTAILGDQFVKGIKFEQKGKIKELAVDGVIIEIGRMPNTEFVKKLVKLDKHGHIIIDHQCNTNVPGIFAAGDCASGHEYQYVISAGQGCMALLKAARYLNTKK